MSQEKLCPNSIYPEIKPFSQPGHISGYPTGPNCRAGQLVEGHAGWRTFRPEIDRAKCTGCWMCYLLCPDAAIYKNENRAAVNYDFCKGCGICARHCPTRAIVMKKEHENER